MKENPFETIEKLWVLVLPVDLVPRIPYMGTDGRLELFTDQALAEAAVEHLKSRLQVLTAAALYDGKEEILGFFRTCMKSGMVCFRLNNGSSEMQEYKFQDLFEYREKNLVDEKNRSVYYMLLRSKEYLFYRGRLPKEEERGKIWRSLAEMEMTMRFNAYREMYNGILYALVGKIKDDDYHDYYTQAAVDRAKEWLKNPEIIESGYKAVHLLHPEHQGGVLYTEPLSLYYVNSPGKAGNPADGLVCVFTSYEEAQNGQRFFENGGMPCSIAAVTVQELMREAMKCRGVLIDLQTLDYSILKEQFSEWKVYGEMDGPILVSLSDKKTTS